MTVMCWYFRFGKQAQKSPILSPIMEKKLHKTQFCSVGAASGSAVSQIVSPDFSPTACVGPLSVRL